MIKVASIKYIDIRLKMCVLNKHISSSAPKYTTSSDEGSSSDSEDDLLSLFANLSMEQKKNLNELIETINEKDDLLECQKSLKKKN